MPQHGSRALVGPMANALYFPPMHVENNVLDQLHFQAKKIIKALNEMSGSIIGSSLYWVGRGANISFITLPPLREFQRLKQPSRRALDRCFNL
jgi:hypothetical protein